MLQQQKYRGHTITVQTTEAIASEAVEAFGAQFLVFGGPKVVKQTIVEGGFSNRSMAVLHAVQLARQQIDSMVDDGVES